ncbi:MAG: DUF63 family protein [Methanoculleaceae archaeon]
MVVEFIYKYYIDPIRYGYPYTVVDTLTYAVILIIAIYLLYRWMNKAGIAIDRELLLSTLPFIIFGGLLRVVEDADIIAGWPHYLLITPLIYFLVFFYTTVILFISRQMAASGITKRYSTLYRWVGTASCAVVFLILLVHGTQQTRVDPIIPFLILAVATGTTVWLAVGLSRVAGWGFVTSNPLYITLIFGHMLDAAATSIGIDLHELHYVEQHVLGSAIIGATGTAFSMFILKLVVLIPALAILEYTRKEEGGGDLWHLVLLAMIVVGLAPGVRDMVRMMIYV